MASKVQLNLEKRLPFLRDLVERSVFNEKEVAEIVKTLTKHEAALVRQGTQPRDVIEYAEYEQKLDSLRRMRVKRLKLATNPPALSDYALSRHILQLYSRGTRRFAHSKKLWQRYIAYTLEGQSDKATSNALTGAVAALPHVAEFWIMAAQWEADGSGQRGGGNMDGARKLLMRGLRFNRGDASLWLEWARLELAFAERMRTRWTTLGLLNDHKPPDEHVQISAEDDGALEEAIEQQADIAEGDETGKAAIVNGALVDLVLQHAFSACADDHLTKGLLQLLRTLPDSSRLRSRFIVQTLAHLGNIESPSTTQRVLLATAPYYEIDTSDDASALEGLASSASALQRLVNDAPLDAELRLEAMRFLVDRLAEAEQPETAAFLSGHVALHWRSALKRNKANSDLARLRVQQLITDGVSETDESMQEVRAFLTEDRGEVALSLLELERASEKRVATLDQHLTFLAALVQNGRAAEVPVRLKRIQGRLTAEDARTLEALWSTKMS